MADRVGAMMTDRRATQARLDAGRWDDDAAARAPTRRLRRDRGATHERHRHTAGAALLLPPASTSCRSTAAGATAGITSWTTWRDATR